MNSSAIGKRIDDWPKRLQGRAIATLFVACFYLLSGSTSAVAKVALARVFGDNMVLQADRPIEIWGSATPNESIAVTLGQARRRTVADTQGQWSVRFPPLAASYVATKIQVQGNDSIHLQNVLVGEVWLAAGQSNMAWPLSRVDNAEDEMRQADVPALRFCQLTGAAHAGAGAYSRQQRAHLAPDKYMSGDWRPSSSSAAGSFSAVAYFFGKQLREQLDVPVGILCPAVGGTPTESWIRRGALGASPQLAALTEGNWLDNPALCEWCRQRAKDNLSWGASDAMPISGDDLGPYHPFRPGYMWEAGVEPLTRLGTRGVIWYQGESNAESAGLVAQHRYLFELLVTDWRAQFRQSGLPFLFVQLPALGRPHWPAFRQSQLECDLAVEHTGMAVTIDLGHPRDVHPTNKRPVGQRLANLALGEVYGHLDASAYTYPKAVSASLHGGEAYVSFGGVAGKLISRDGAPLRHFEIAGADREFTTASARIEGKALAVWSDSVSSPRFVRYAWVPYPTPPVNLFSAAGLPASPFELSVLQPGEK